MRKTEKKYDITLGRKAINKLEGLATYYSFPKKDITQVIIKGIQVLQAAKDAGTNNLIIQPSSGEAKKIDIRQL